MVLLEYKQGSLWIYICSWALKKSVQISTSLKQVFQDDTGEVKNKAQDDLQTSKPSLEASEIKANIVHPVQSLSACSQKQFCAGKQV